VLIRA